MHSRSRLWTLVCVALLKVALPSVAQAMANVNGTVPWNLESLSDSLVEAPVSVDNKDYYNEPTEEPDLFYSDLHPCPRACDDKHADEWDLLLTKDGLKFCAEPMLLDLALYNPLDSPRLATTLRACTQGDAQSRVNAASTSPEPIEAQNRFVVKRQGQRRARERRSSAKCVVGEDRPSQLQLSGVGSKNIAQWDATSTLLGHISDFFRDEATCHYKIMLGYLNGTIVGLYAGEAINKASVQNAIEAAHNSLAENAVSSFTLELCNPDYSSAHVLGLIALAGTDLAAVQKMLRSWDNAECAESAASARTVDVLIKAEPFTFLNQTMSNSTVSAFPMRSNATRRHWSSLVSRAACSVQTVVLGDNCESLAAKCGISLADFKKHNPVEEMCTPTGLFEDMEVCCSEGRLPDRTKQPDKDGNCAWHYVQPTDNCHKIAIRYGITVADLEKFNAGRDGTWGWAGCLKLNAYMNICVSKGDPPMPAPIPNAVCGPVKPGSRPPRKGFLLKQKLTSMNPCPLNACCNVWGNCGLSKEFCLKERGPTGNPGTSPANQWGCISHCGIDIVSSDAPVEYGRVGYYESWNFDRSCLYLQAKNANTDGTYTIIHWAFMEIDTETWAPKIKDPHKQWSGFTNLASVKKVISFGGWGFSTEPQTYDILRQAMSPEHRAQFAGNVVKFLIENNLDGADFDWEYPGATDIDGTPAGTPEDGRNYLLFLVTLSEKLRKQPPYHFTLSIAAPASFWYLKAFPIKQMARYLDYIVYMTYDLHGQWDAGNKWTSEGCPGGNCLRSHINLTETTTALAMITKAGVPSNKIFVGEASYGRSFKMSEEGCEGPDCTFEGDRTHSQAAPGRCTNTSGYIARAEIDQIILNDPTAKSWHDGRSNSDILVYDDTEWVAYMTPTTKNTRRNFWKGKNFAGTIDWAVDLMDYHGNDESAGSGLGDLGEFDGNSKNPTPCTSIYTTLEDIEANKDRISMHCRDEYILKVLKKSLETAIDDHDELLRGRYDHNFDIYAGAVAGNVKSAVKDFMYKHGADYFTCSVTEPIDSCEHCHLWFGIGEKTPDTKCRYCEDFNCGYKSMFCRPPSCNVDHTYRFKEMDMACPPDFSQRSEKPDKTNKIMSSTKWTLRDDQSDAFYAELLANTAVTSDVVVWEDVRWDWPPGRKYSKHASDPIYVDFNFPNPKHFSKKDVPNPREVIDKGREKLQSIIPAIEDVLDKISKGEYAGFVGDMVDGLAVPVVMAQQSRKNFILLFISAILFFLPFIGEVAGTVAALAGAARLLIILGDLGSVGMDIYSMVDSKGSDPFAIVGLIFAPLAFFDAARMAAAAGLRRGMKDANVKSLGNEAKATLDMIDRIKGRKVCSIGGKRDMVMELPWDSPLSMSGLNGEPVPVRM